jgi:hypothetical protein
MSEDLLRNEDLDVEGHVRRAANDEAVEDKDKDEDEVEAHVRKASPRQD